MKKILIVESDDRTRRGVLRILQDSGHEVVPAKSKAEALGVIQRWKPELAIASLDLGNGTDGLDLLKEADAAHLQTEFWLVPNTLIDTVTAQALELGAKTVIARSLVISHLLAEKIISLAVNTDTKAA